MAGLLTISMMAALSIGASAATPTTTTVTGAGTANGDVEIDGTILPLTISVTHPAVVNYTIDPNTGTFTADPIDVTSNSKSNINVTMQSLKSITVGTLQFHDAAPDSEDLANLNTSDTKKYIALGVGITKSNGWNAGYTTLTDWAASASAIDFGQLTSGSTGSMSLSAKYGLAWDKGYTAKHQLIFLFSLV